MTRLEPYPFQTEAIERGIEGNLLCADDCGLGKTLVGIEIAMDRAVAYGGPNLVICTKASRYQWAEAIHNQTGRTEAHEVIILDKHHGLPSFVNSHTYGIWIVTHYEALIGLTKKDPLARVLFSTIIVDEAHRIKNRKAKRTLNVKRLLGRRKVALTATEMEKSPEDIWSILNWLDPKKWRGFHGFCAKYVEYEVHPWLKYRKVVGTRNMDKFVREIAPSYIKRTKQDVRPDLPPLREQRVPVEPSETMLTVLRKVRDADDVFVPIGNEELFVANMLAKITMQRQISSHGRNLTKATKLDWVKDYVEDNPKTSVLILAVFRDTAQQLARMFDAPLVIGQGEMPDLSTHPRVIVGTIAKMGESLDLPWIDTVIFVDSDWSHTKMYQAKNRIHRLGIENPKLALYLYHPGTVDELVFKALDQKMSNAEIVLEYLRTYVQGGADVFEM